MLGHDFYGIALIVVIACILLIHALISLPSRFRSAPRPRRFGSTTSRFARHAASDMRDVGDQLHAVMAASFEKRRLLSPSEYRVFKIVETDVAAVRRGYRVFAQTSLGEILASPDEDAFRSINSKRVDILVVDQGGWPVVAVEYQGSGHYQGTAAARDAVKKEALRKAGVRYLEICDEDGEEQIRSRVREQLRQNTVAANSAETRRIA